MILAYSHFPIAIYLSDKGRVNFYVSLDYWY
jgi:hypothetical protein